MYRIVRSDGGTRYILVNGAKYRPMNSALDRSVYVGMQVTVYSRPKSGQTPTKLDVYTPGQGVSYWARSNRKAIPASKKPATKAALAEFDGVARSQRSFGGTTVKITVSDGTAKIGNNKSGADIWLSVKGRTGGTANLYLSFSAWEDFVTEIGLLRIEATKNVESEMERIIALYTKPKPTRKKA